MLKSVGNPSTRYGDQTIIDGNLVIGTAGKGIDFSATSGTGTSELLNDYEEGTWSPNDASGAGLVFVNASATYTKIGNTIRITGQLSYPATADGSNLAIGGLPFSSSGNASLSILNTSANTGDMVLIPNGSALILIYTSSATRRTNSDYSGVDVYFSGVYKG